MFTSRDQEAAKQLVEDLDGKASPSAASRPTSAIPCCAKEVVDRLVEQSGRIDILVNSAGIIRDGLLGSMTDEMWQEVAAINSTARSITAGPSVST